MTSKERFLPALLLMYYFLLEKKEEDVFDMFQSDVEKNVSPGFPELKKAGVLVPKQGRKITSPAVYFVYGQSLRHVFCSI